MSKNSAHNCHALYTLLLIVVLMGSILAKPVHILLVHHALVEVVHSESDQKTFSTLHSHDCSICDYEFCTFIPHKQVIVPQVNIIPTNELASRMVACFFCNSSHNFQLRAPPVF